MAKVQREIPKNTLDVGVLDDGQVVMQFGELTKQMTFTPEQAKQVGLGLIEMGTRAESLTRATFNEKRDGKSASTMSRVKH